MNSVEQFYMNKTQQLAYLIDAPFAIHMIGRGTGKTEGILAPKLIRRVIEMPRATFLLVAATFQQILTRTLPPLVAGLERMGYKLDTHYLVGEKPSKAWINLWNWQHPIRPPFDWKYTMCFWNGTIIQFISQDKIGSTNGMSVDYIFGDEAKLLNYERLSSETFPANRGVIKDFENNIHHHGWTFTTDMPNGTSGSWLFAFMDKCDKKTARKILTTEMLIEQKILERKTKKNFSESAPRIDKEVQLLKNYARELRKNYLYFQSGSSIQNINILGVQYFKNLMRDLPKKEMMTAILNMKPKAIEGCFYADLDEEKHGYFDYSYSLFENTGYNMDKLILGNNANVDNDYNPNLPLHISLDYNKDITPLVVGQIHQATGELRIINTFHSLYPEKLKDTLQKFIEYYKGHNNRTVYYWHDHTTVNEYAHVEGTQADQVVKYLSNPRLKGGRWSCVPMYSGKASNHEMRYAMYGELLQETGKYPYKLRINRDRCKYLLVSMFGTGTVSRAKGFGKDKSSEQKKNVPAEEATHYGEALDMLVWGLLESGLQVQTHQSDSGLLVF